jgi:DNA polymerase/3'-5' exonuclease PolX
LGITSKEELLKACEEGKIALVKGFGEKTQESIKNSLLFIQSQSGKHLYSEVEKYAIQIEDLLKKHKSIQQVSLCGTIRRKSEIIETIKEKIKSKTVIFISHRFSTVRMADRILVIDKGKITEEGTHEKLLNNGGLYSTMFKLQAKGYA